MAVKSIAQMLAEYQDNPLAPLVIGDGWAQGRAVYGGLASAIGLGAMQFMVDRDKPLRSLMTSFIGPMPTDGVEVKPRILREGKSVTQATVEVLAEEGPVLMCSAAFGFARKTLSVEPNVSFHPAPRESVPRLDGRILEFLDRFDIHWTGGGIPASGTKERTLGMWVRHKEDLNEHPAVKIVALADMPPPIIMCHYKVPLRASSLSWSLEFVVPPQEVKTDWFYLHFELVAGADGYTQQNGSIFDENGRLLALSRQCMVYFEPK